MSTIVHELADVASDTIGDGTRIGNISLYFRS